MEDKWEYPSQSNDIAIVALVDKSGSMSGTTSDTIGGFNNFKKDQAKLPGRAYMSVSLFASSSHVLYPSNLIQNIPDLSTETYRADGSSTALYDAVAHTIQEVSKSKNLPKRVVFLVITDGQENSSRKFTTPESVRALIEEKTSQGWDFIYLGADASAWSASRSLGFTSSGVYDQDFAGINMAYSNLSASVGAMRSSGLSSNSYNFNTSSTVVPPLITPNSNTTPTGVTGKTTDIYVNTTFTDSDNNPII